MSGKTSQAKGRTAELELSRILQGYGYDVRPGGALNYGTEPDLVGLDGVHCEVKRCEQTRLNAWIDQARRDADKFHDGLPAVFWRKNRCPWLVVMDLRDWIALYGRQKTAENGRKRQQKKSTGENCEPLKRAENSI